ncbi:MAG TPA: DEAD/DEAH box helicase, partial [Clostridiales bacterium]|nr:DEAD/DEAH box helicase [Clostridiales bacterium]
MPAQDDLHYYQRFSVDFIEKNSASAIFLDCGLGKTVITLTALNDLLFDSFKAHRVLVIAPLRVARDTWPAEADKWDHLQNLICSVAVGSEAERRAALLRPADIYIINRENVQWLIDESGIPFDFDTVVIDELSSFKNHQAKRFRALMKVRPKVKRVIGLTGTPSSNGLMDLWAEFRLLDMGERLGRFISYYRLDYFVPDQCNGPVVYSFKPQQGAEQRIYNKISDITISMKSTDLLKMPELVSSEYTVHLSSAERKRYEKLKRALVLDLPAGCVTAANAAALSGKLCQMANG